MADFRRWVTALAVLALFAGLAGAQTGSTGTSPLVCSSVAQVTPTLRAEGVTELVGDIVITCSGGNFVTTGQPIPQANLVVSLTAPVTSRLRSSSTGSSEALLLIDEPNSGLSAPVALFGPEAPLNVCTSVSGGCIEYATQVSSKAGACVPATGVNCVTVATDTVGGAVAGKNVFEGVVSGNQVSFNGIPILPPVTTGINRVYRITNIRVNATGATGGVGGGIVPITAFLSASGSTSLPVSNASVTVGFVQTSLTPTVTSDKPGGALTSAGVNSFTQCNAPSGTTTTTGTAVPIGNVAFLNFSENFPNAFKTRVGINPNTGKFTSPPFGTTTAPPSSFLGTGSGTGYTQNVPGTLYNSESGFILDVGTVSSGAAFTAGLADSGTRFQAVFNNIPAGATLYVSRYTMTSFTTASNSNVGLPPAAGSTQSAVAVLTTGGASGVFTDVAASKPQFVGGTAEVVALTATSGSATAVWEVTNTNTSANETFSFAVFISFTPNLTSNQPTPGNAATVTLSYAPISSTTWIPRFIAGPASTAMPLLNINKCNTVLLFPYITSSAGFDTGIAISNTSADPLTNPATGQSPAGTCALSFYGANAPTGTVAPLGPIPAGNGADPTKFAFMLSTVAPNFTGYMFAVCDFQFAHGFAFISDVGTRNLAMGYLALIVNPGGNISRPALPSGEGLNQ
ncbi:MAG: hypothetical protein LAQ30_14635 [Acidobacteriia bacterium]|nr:hypothetical protein [Terriglobia bacterium]